MTNEEPPNRLLPERMFNQSTINHEEEEFTDEQSNQDNEIISVRSASHNERARSESDVTTRDNPRAIYPTFTPKIPSAPAIHKSESNISLQVRTVSSQTDQSNPIDEIQANEKQYANDQDANDTNESGLQNVANVLTEINTKFDVNRILGDAYQQLEYKEEQMKLNKRFIKKYAKEERFLREDLKKQYAKLGPIFKNIWEPRKREIMLEAFKISQESHSNTALKLLAQTCSIVTTISLAYEEDTLQMEQFISRVQDVFNIGGIFREEKKPIHAFASYYIASKLYRFQNQEEFSFSGIQNCIEQEHLVVKQGGKKEKYFHHYSIPMLCEMLELLLKIDSRDKTVKVRSHAQCALYIGECYFELDDFQKSLLMNEQAVEMFRAEISEPEKYNIFGKCLSKMGKVYNRTGKPQEALEYYDLAFQSLQKANDWKSDSEKVVSIRCVDSEREKLRRIHN
ncbi:uncharacterized protein LOC144425817 [Styela clava]